MHHAGFHSAFDINPARRFGVTWNLGRPLEQGRRAARMAAETHDPRCTLVASAHRLTLAAASHRGQARFPLTDAVEPAACRPPQDALGNDRYCAHRFP